MQAIHEHTAACKYTHFVTPVLTFLSDVKKIYSTSLQDGQVVRPMHALHMQPLVSCSGSAMGHAVPGSACRVH